VPIIVMIELARLFDGVLDHLLGGQPASIRWLPPRPTINSTATRLRSDAVKHQRHLPVGSNQARYDCRHTDDWFGLLRMTQCLALGELSSKPIFCSALQSKQRASPIIYKASEPNADGWVKQLEVRTDYAYPWVIACLSITR